MTEPPRRRQRADLPVDRPVSLQVDAEVGRWPPAAWWSSRRHRILDSDSAEGCVDCQRCLHTAIHDSTIGNFKTGLQSADRVFKVFYPT